jgi:hypothetical protein
MRLVNFLMSIYSSYMGSRDPPETLREHVVCGILYFSGESSQRGGFNIAEELDMVRLKLNSNCDGGSASPNGFVQAEYPNGNL